MVGRVTSTARCKQCGRRFAARVVEDPGGAALLQCKCGAYVGSPCIRLSWEGRKLSVLYDDRGERLRTVIHARRALDQIRNQIERGEFRPEYWGPRRENPLSWPIYLDNYLAAEEKRLLPEGRDSTFRAKRAAVKRLKLIGPKNVRDIREGDIEDLLAVPDFARLASKTKQTTLEELRRIFRRAERRGDLNRIPDVPMISVPRQAVKYYSADQMAQVFEKLPTAHRPIFNFLYLYGARPGEAGGLCWDYVDVGQGIFWLARTLSDRRLGRTTKNRSADPLPIVEEFAEHLSRATRGIGENPVFANRDADRRRNPKRFYHVEFLNRLWSKAIAAAELEPLPLKNIRHSTAMYLLNVKGLPGDVVQRILRHSSGEYLDVYTRHQTATLAKALAKNKVSALSKRR